MSLAYFAKIRKSVKKLKLDDLIHNLKIAYSKAHKAADRDFLLKHLSFLQEKGLDNLATRKDLDFVLKDIEKTLGQKLESLAEAPFLQASMEAYTDGKRKVCKPFKIDYSLDDADLGALNTLDEFNGWYIKNKMSKETSEIINRELGDLLERGGTKAEFAKTLETALEDHVTASKTYWEILADHSLTKIQNMGHVSGYETAGVQYVKIVAVIDSKTTPVCRAMNNKVFKVADFRKQYDKIIHAAEKHDLKAYKAAQPMISSKAMKGEISDEDIKRLGIKLPPYHFRCRTTHVAYFGEIQHKKLSSPKYTDAEQVKFTTQIPRELPKDKIKYLAPKLLEKELSEKEIIDKVGGFDGTTGSCSSTALAYIANKCGYDVLDFRGGDSWDWFSEQEAIKQIIEAVGGDIIISHNSKKATDALFKKVKENTEYLFTTGIHTTIIKKEKGKIKYLELQSNNPKRPNGFYDFKNETLYGRFRGSHNCDLDVNGLAEVEKFKKNKSFTEILGFINTLPEDQLKQK